jgi:hypothetical protein
MILSYKMFVWGQRYGESVKRAYKDVSKDYFFGALLVHSNYFPWLLREFEIYRWSSLSLTIFMSKNSEAFALYQQTKGK